MDTRQRGVIRRWNDEKGFGFIAPVAGGADLFFHVKSVTNSRRRDLEGQRVTYAVAPGRDGKASAVDVRLAVEEIEEAATGPVVRERRRGERRRGGRRWPHGPTGELVAWAVCIAFLATVTALSLLYASPIVPAVYVVLSALTYTTYSRDKDNAQAGYWRVPESTLHLMELVGGWPGALVAQWRLRHKNRKVSYQVIFWLAVITHLSAAGFIIHLIQNKGTGATAAAAESRPIGAVDVYVHPPNSPAPPRRTPYIP